MGLQKIWLSVFVLSFTSFSYGVERKPLEFQTKKIMVSGISLKVALADDVEKRTNGMMFVENWSKYQGMLFIFEKAQVRNFWMKNTFLPLSLGFYDENKKLIETVDLNPPVSMAQVNVDKAVSSKPAKYVLEVPKGWFKKHKISVESKITGI